jgi:hypothetical protein
MQALRRSFKPSTSPSPSDPLALPATPAGPVDPPETWELPYRQADNAYYRGVQDAYPRSPRCTEEVPAGALESLRWSCGVQGLHQMFIIPSAVRAVGRKDQRVTSPKSILALGSRAVGLWTEMPEPGVKVVIGLQQLSAIEDVMILLYGRLSFYAAGGRLTVRYNTLARTRIEPALLGLRRRLAGIEEPVPSQAGGGEALPFKWMQTVCSARVRLHEQAPVAYRFATSPARSRHDFERAQLLVLNAHELIYLCDPPAASHRYGEDSFVLPRSGISAVRLGEQSTGFTCNGTHFSLPMHSELRRAAARWLL